MTTTQGRAETITGKDVMSVPNIIDSTPTEIFMNIVQTGFDTDWSFEDVKRFRLINKATAEAGMHLIFRTAMFGPAEIDMRYIGEDDLDYADEKTRRDRLRTMKTILLSNTKRDFAALIREIIIDTTDHHGTAIYCEEMKWMVQRMSRAKDLRTVKFTNRRGDATADQVARILHSIGSGPATLILEYIKDIDVDMFYNSPSLRKVIMKDCTPAQPSNKCPSYRPIIEEFGFQTTPWSHHSIRPPATMLHGLDFSNLTSYTSSPRSELERKVTQYVLEESRKSLLTLKLLAGGLSEVPELSPCVLQSLTLLEVHMRAKYSDQAVDTKQFEAIAQMLSTITAPKIRAIRVIIILSMITPNQGEHAIRRSWEALDKEISRHANNAQTLPMTFGVQFHRDTLEVDKRTGERIYDLVDTPEFNRLWAPRCYSKNEVQLE